MIDSNKNSSRMALRKLVLEPHNSLHENYKELVAEVFILAFDDLVDDMKLLKEVKDIRKYEAEEGSRMDRLTFSGAIGNAREVYDFFVGACPKYYNYMTPSLFVRKAAEKAGISFEKGMEICTRPKERDVEVSDFTKKVLAKVSEELSKKEEL